MRACVLTQKSEEAPASSASLLAMPMRWELESPDLTSSWVLAPAVDPRFKQFLDQAAIETVKSELVSCMEAFSASNSPDTRASENQPPGKRQKRTALDILLGPDVNSSTVLTARDELELYMSERPVARKKSPLGWIEGE